VRRPHRLGQDHHAALGAGPTSTPPERKIWTAEDPIEITQPGLRQVQVNPKIDWTFAKALRAFLRADPDVIMVGEIRDKETAKHGHRGLADRPPGAVDAAHQQRARRP
jgi:endonuclease/exonuclease/phosphatase (EEP) superfamily protein YafD